MALTCPLAVVLAGYGTGSDTPGYAPKGEELLREVWSMYKSHLDAKKRPPAKLSDLDPYEPAATHGYAALRDGEVVMVWGATGSRVLAYEKQVPEQGGAVLYADGTVKRITGEEFRAAHKVK